MSYLKIVDEKVQELAESVSSILNIHVTVVDENLIRIAGTGDFFGRINESSPVNSLFDRVLKNGDKLINLYDENKEKCINCSYLDSCKERSSIIYPIIIQGEVLGVACFASFDRKEEEIMRSKITEYLEMLKHFTHLIEKEISDIMMKNQLNKGKAEINGIINYINKGIIIINRDKVISYINIRAIKLLKLDLSKDELINIKISKIISNIKFEETLEHELRDTWEVNNLNLKVIYKVNYIVIDKVNVSILIDFDTVEEIITAAATYSNDNTISFDSIISCSEVMTNIKEKAKIAAKSMSTVLLQGASGTGKELFARSIHNDSSCKDGPFVAINCATLPENLIESELFGYEKGSFTGANPKGKIGKFEQANNGTLFLDEIADLPLHLQAKLLRVLQEKKIERIGSIHSTDINVRIICATHKDLESMVAKNHFREDLFYRLNVIPLRIPSLNERREDIPLLTEYVTHRLSKRLGKPIKAVSKEVGDSFMHYEWTGNVRELENILEYAINFSVGKEINISSLPEYFIQNIKRDRDFIQLNADESLCISKIESLDEMTKEYEKKVISHLLDKYGRDKQTKEKVAKTLNISITTLYRKLNNYC